MEQLLMAVRSADSRNRDERGAFAVLTALLVVFMCGMAAVAVDLGNAYQRKGETQSQADLAALSAAPALATSHSAALLKVVAYLKNNEKVGQDLSSLSSTTLTDGDPTNGEVTFPSTYSMRVRTPDAAVDYAFAGVIGFEGDGEVSAAATVGVGTPGGSAVMPYYAVTGAGCDYGTQSLTDPANGQAQSVVPSLAAPTTTPTQTSNANLTGAAPYQFDVGTTGAITLNGARLASVGRIGFFRTPTETPNVFEETVTVNTNNSVVTGAPVPTNVTNYPGVWWVRVYKTSGNIGWSPVAEAIPIRIGDGPIQCGNLSSSGNFGTLKLARSTSPSTWAPDNIAVGLQSPLSLQVQGDTTQIPLCTPGAPNVTYTATQGNATRYPNTNCVDTDTGLTAQVTTQGLITGTGSGYPGRLVRPTTTAVPGRQCAVGHTSNQRTMLSKALNDDTLTCFMTNPNQALGSIASATYNAGAALDPAIYDSPRFCYVPVVAVTPATGGSQHYSIVDVRPCFITSESNTSTYNTQSFLDTTNGLTIPSNKVTTMRVFFFNKKALPSAGVGDPDVILDPSGPLVSVLTD